MHSWTNRLNSMGSFVTTVVFGICIATALSDLMFKPYQKVNAAVNRLEQVVIANRNDEAVGMELSLDADFEGLFSWNTKQLFVFLTVDYATELNAFNQIVVWDQIVASKEEARIKMRRVRPEYRVVDQGRGLKGTPYNLTVHWNVMPWVGRLTLHNQTFTGYRFNY